MFIQYFMLTLAISLFCLGLRAITDNGMIGYPLRLFFQKYAPSWGKPFILCVTCMSSFWGTVIYWGHVLPVEDFSLTLLTSWLGVAISSSFVNSIFWEYYQSITSCKQQ